MPGVSSSKNRIKPAPPDGIGPSPRFPFLFLAVFGINYHLDLGWFSTFYGVY
jgi:hypothetical protein